MAFAAGTEACAPVMPVWKYMAIIPEQLPSSEGSPQYYRSTAIALISRSSMTMPPFKAHYDQHMHAVFADTHGQQA